MHGQQVKVRCHTMAFDIKKGSNIWGVPGTVSYPLIIWIQLLHNGKDPWMGRHNVTGLHRKRWTDLDKISQGSALIFFVLGLPFTNWEDETFGSAVRELDKSVDRCTVGSVSHAFEDFLFLAVENPS